MSLGKYFHKRYHNKIVDYEKNGDKIFDEMIKEKLQPDITVGIFAPAKKLQLNSFKKHLRKTTVKLKDRIVQLGYDANN